MASLTKLVSPSRPRDSSETFLLANSLGIAPKVPFANLFSSENVPMLVCSSCDKKKPCPVPPLFRNLGPVYMEVGDPR